MAAMDLRVLTLMKELGGGWDPEAIGVYDKQATFPVLADSGKVEDMDNNSARESAERRYRTVVDQQLALCLGGFHQGKRHSDATFLPNGGFVHREWSVNTCATILTDPRTAGDDFGGSRNDD